MSRSLKSPGILRWEREADVLVVGYGGAGAVSAITAYDAGAQALVLEKMEQGKEGGNTRVSAGIVFSPDDVEGAKEYLRSLCCRTVDEETIGVMAESMAGNADYLISLGADPNGKVKRGAGTFPDLPGSRKCATSFYTPGNGYGLFSILAEQVGRRGIEVLYRTSGKELIQGEQGEVLGVIAEQDGRILPIKARRGVILTCGGFLFDLEMQKNFLSAWPYFGFGTPANTGDGIRMAQKAGAGLWHMAGVLGPTAPAFQAPGMETPLLIGMPGDGYIFVDRYGHRFMNEKKDPRFGKGWQEILFHDGRGTEFPRIPWFIVFDEKNRTRGPLVQKTREIVSGELRVSVSNTWSIVMGRSEWSADNQREIEIGWITRGESISGLALTLKVAPSVLEESVARYNRWCESRSDSEFGRASDTLERIASPPYYAIQVYPGAIGTQGGPRRNARSQVVDPFGWPIPRLYSAGECGSVWGFLYQASGNLAECIAFGRIAGRNAASEGPWN